MTALSDSFYCQLATLMWSVVGERTLPLQRFLKVLFGGGNGSSEMLLRDLVMNSFRQLHRTCKIQPDVFWCGFLNAPPDLIRIAAPALIKNIPVRTKSHVNHLQFDA